MVKRQQPDDRNRCQAQQFKLPGLPSNHEKNPFQDEYYAHRECQQIGGLRAVREREKGNLEIDEHEADRVGGSEIIDPVVGRAEPDVVQIVR